MSNPGFKPRLRQRARRDSRVKVKPGVNIDDPLVRRGCVEKQKRMGKKRALQAAARATLKHQQPFHAYRCSYCGCFHLSSSIPRDERFKVSEVVVPAGSNGRIGKLWLPEFEDELAIELFVDRVWYFAGLDTRGISLNDSLSY